MAAYPVSAQYEGLSAPLDARFVQEWARAVQEYAALRHHANEALLSRSRRDITTRSEKARRVCTDPALPLCRKCGARPRALRMNDTTDTYCVLCRREILKGYRDRDRERNRRAP